MKKQDELERLFDAVVEHLQNPDDKYLLEQMQEQKIACQIMWPQDTMDTCKTAMIYAQNHQNGFGVRA